MKIEFDIFYLPVQRELEVLCSKNIIHNFIPIYYSFWNKSLEKMPKRVELKILNFSIFFIWF